MNRRPLYDGLSALRQFLSAREGQCLKKAFDSQAEARLFNRRRQGGQRAYQCWCGKWHLTSQGEVK